MAALLPALPGKECLTASVMSFGFDPGRGDLYEGAKGVVKEALAKFACLGGDPFGARLSMQEYFERMETPESWGKPVAALLGALEAQLALGVPAIGGKDSMSGSYRDSAHGIDIAVPPTLAVFAAGTTPAAAVRSGALSGEPGRPVLLLYQDIAADVNRVATDEWTLFRTNMNAVAELTRRGLVKAAYPVGPGGTAAALALMAFGNMTGLDVCAEALAAVDRENYPGAVLLELACAEVPDMPAGAVWIPAAKTIAEPVFRIGGEEKSLAELRKAYESVLENVYPQRSEDPGAAAGALYAQTVFNKTVKQAGTDKAGGNGADSVTHNAGRTAAGRAGKGRARPLVLVPVFPGTNGEWDMEQAFLKAGARVRQLVFRNRSAEDIAVSTKELAAAVDEAQIVAFSGGFSAGDEPDGSGKFIANALRSPVLADAIRRLLEQRDGLMLGICNGFQALVKLGLVPYGRYTEAASGMLTLSFNRIGRHISRMVRTTVMSKLSPWLALEEPGAVHNLPVSHGEGRLVASETEGKALFAAGQVAFCYAGEDGLPAVSEPDNPNGSDFAIEGLSSPDGRVLGKMGHSERSGRFVHVNVPGNKNQKIFEAGVAYFD
jgi:phosphoribosylformylglycinamidine synthase